MVTWRRFHDPAQERRRDVLRAWRGAKDPRPEAEPSRSGPKDAPRRCGGELPHGGAKAAACGTGKSA